MFIHAVYFWLKEDLTAEQREAFVRGVTSLREIGSVRHVYVGVPAPTERPVIERSYAYALTVVFDDQAGHDLYQDDPVHDRFRRDCAPFWNRVLIYDSIEQS